MTTIRSLIVDDEPLARRGIRQLLVPYPDIEVVGECRDGREALRALSTVNPDLVFLDIQMPGLDGLSVMRLYGPERMPVTVFVTAHDEFAVRAFEAAALDYLVKPLSEARFRAAIARVRQRIRMSDAMALARQFTALLENHPEPVGVERHPRHPSTSTPGMTIAVPTQAGELLLDAAAIDWIGAEDDHVGIHAGGRHYRLRESLRSLERRLGASGFARVHRSAIVRLDQVREWRTMPSEREAVVVLRDGTTLPVGRRRLARVKALLRSPRPRS